MPTDFPQLSKIDSSPTWQVPLLYQIALCEEKLGNYVQATETYISIENFVNSVKEAREDLASSEYLNFVFGMANGGVSNSRNLAKTGCQSQWYLQLVQIQVPSSIRVRTELPGR